MNQEALNKITKARTALLIEQPFFGALAMRLKLVQDESIPTECIDGKTLRYNPKFMNGLTHLQAMSEVAHEVMHCVLGHVGADGRGINLNPKKWNHAADYAVNGILKKAGFVMDETWLWDAQFDGMTAEHIYSLIPDPPPGEGNGPGSGNGGPQDEVLPGAPDPSMAAADAADWKIAAAQSATAAKAAGKLSEALEQFIEQLQENKVDWQAELRQFVCTAAKNDYSWRKPNRMMQAAGFILPGMYSEAVGQIDIFVDESGSVDNAVLAAFSAEIRAIQQDMRPEKIQLHHFTTAVGTTEIFEPDDDFELVRKHNGGTDFTKLFKHAEGAMCAIVLTDLEGPFPKFEPEFPVLWVSINKQVAPFGTTLHIEV